MKAFLCNDFVNFLCAVRRRDSDYMTIGPIAQSDNVGSGKHLGKQSINYHYVCGLRFPYLYLLKNGPLGVEIDFIVDMYFFSFRE